MSSPLGVAIVIVVFAFKELTGHVSSPSTSDEPGSAERAQVEPAETEGEQGQDHSLAIELDAVVNWLENLDLGEKCGLVSS
eukprot:SAG31_NODE_1451_length_8305_cov_8.321350_8_plen_81_part_00